MLSTSLSGLSRLDNNASATEARSAGVGCQQKATLLYLSIGAKEVRTVSQSQESIEKQALDLPRNERAQVALHLLDSLEQEDPSVSRGTIERAWVEESVRRLEAYRRGEMEAYPAEEVIAELERSAE